jgi:hypothetical protein
MPEPSGRSWLRRLFPVVFIAGTAALIIGVVSYLRPKPLLSADDPPDVIYQKIIAAYGGRDALDRWTSGRLHYEVEFDFPDVGKWKARFREKFQLPGKLRREMEMDFRDEALPPTLMIANGNSHWSKKDKELIQMGGDNPYKETRCVEIVRSFHPEFLLAGGKGLTTHGIGHRPDRGRDLLLKIPIDDREPTECRVDLLTGLIREYIGPIAVPLQSEPVTVRYEFADYRPTPGGPVPHRMTGYREGKKITELRFTLIDLDTPVDPASFLPPPDAPRP